MVKKKFVMTNTENKFEEVQGRYNGPDLETRVLKFWEENRIFEKSLVQLNGK